MDENEMVKKVGEVVSQRNIMVGQDLKVSKGTK